MTEVEVRASILMGEAWLRLGQFSDARREFENARAEMPKERLVACGEKALKDGIFDDARLAYDAAGAEMPKDGLIACGQKLLEQGLPDAACGAFKEPATVEARARSSGRGVRGVQGTGDR